VSLMRCFKRVWTAKWVPILNGVPTLP
jgi:hypothetical protein